MNATQGELIEQTYWDSSYEHCKLALAPKFSILRLWIERHIPRACSEQDLSAIEIGCFPGSYLAVLGELGYVLNGIDRTPRVERDLPEFLLAQGFRVGTFVRGDFLSCDLGERYDVVASFGFIEHFRNFRQVLTRQAELVKPGGLLVVATPNFRGVVQRMLHCLVDRDNLRRHNLDAMRPEIWRQQIELSGFDVMYCGYFGGLAFWVDKQHRSVPQRVLLFLTEQSARWLSKRCTRNARAYSPYCGLVARRRYAGDSEEMRRSCESLAHG